MSNSDTRPAVPASAGAATTEPVGSALGNWSAAAIITSLVVFAGAGLLRSSWMPPKLQLPRLGPPYELGVQVPPRIILIAIWVAALLAGAGIAAGLAALRRGQPVPMRLIMVAAVVALLVLVIVPPTGSTDPLDYAIYGHIAEIGRSPYVMTPFQYRALFHVQSGVPLDWIHNPSVYGPLATAEEVLASRLGGSLAATTFWLKLVNAVAFAMVAVAADRATRADNAARARVHLLWTANPLLLWNLIAAGHLDVLAAGVGLLGLLVADRWAVRSPSLAYAAAAGVCVGAASAIKADYLLFVLAIAWVLRRRPGQLAAAAAGAAAVLVPGYLVAGVPAIKALASRALGGTGYGFYGFFLHRLGLSLSLSVPIAAVLMIVIGYLMLTRLPEGSADRPAIRIALLLSVVWLMLWPHQFAWYSVMIICVLVFYPASRLDWLVVLWFTVLTISDMPGLGFGRGPNRELGKVLYTIQTQIGEHVAPLVMLVAAAALLALCINGRWNLRQPAGWAPDLP
jgi:hypothetical protein